MGRTLVIDLGAKDAVLHVCKRAVWPLRLWSPPVKLLSQAIAIDDLDRAVGSLAEHSISELHVKLGLEHCRVGVLRVSIEAAKAFAASPQAIVAGWVRRAWGIDPNEYLVRWGSVRGSNDQVVSCVHRARFERLRDLAVRHRYRFTVCVPAILDAFDSSSPAAEIVVWTEAAGAARSGIVQLLHFEGGALRQAWRGWVPAAEDDDHSLALQAHRFMRMHGIGASTPVRRMHWQPSGAGTVA